MTSSERPVQISPALTEEFKKIGFQVSLTKYERKEYVIELSLNTPANYIWNMKIQTFGSKATLISHIAENILEQWSNFDPREQMKIIQNERENGFRNPNLSNEVASDVKFIDDSLKQLTENMQKYFGSRKKALVITEKAKEKKKRIEYDEI